MNECCGRNLHEAAQCWRIDTVDHLRRASACGHSQKIVCIALNALLSNQWGPVELFSSLPGRWSVMRIHAHSQLHHVFGQLPFSVLDRQCLLVRAYRLTGIIAFQALASECFSQNKAEKNKCLGGSLRIPEGAVHWKHEKNVLFLVLPYIISIFMYLSCSWFMIIKLSFSNHSVWQVKNVLKKTTKTLNKWECLRKTETDSFRWNSEKTVGKNGFKDKDTCSCCREKFEKNWENEKQSKKDRHENMKMITFQGKGQRMIMSDADRLKINEKTSKTVQNYNASWKR